MLSIGNKTFMNLQEAVGWLLENNALPFQSTANYAGGVEIAMSTLINPSPAKVRVGSIIFFADSKVSTVVGVTSNSFIVSDQYNDLVDDVVYVSNVAINASGHLIVTLSNGTDIDAGLIKQVSNFSIDASQHLIANYNDGTTTDLGAIFNGNVNIAGNLTADSIIENMSGYSFTSNNITGISFAYVGAVKNGNKLTFVVAGSVLKSSSTPYNAQIGYFYIPADIANKIYPLHPDTTIVAAQQVGFYDQDNLGNDPVMKNVLTGQSAGDNRYMSIQIIALSSSLTNDKTYVFRYELTFLLSNSLI